MPAYAFTTVSQRQRLKCLEIRHPLFHADLLLQGAQLLKFQPAGSHSNWLWLSDEAQFNHGQSVRGGMPICWPWFGNADKNPTAVQHHIDLQRAPAHGFARNQAWQLLSVHESCHSVKVCLQLEINHQPGWQGKAGLQAHFSFSQHSIGVELITQNRAPTTLTFSQAIHTYLPTDDLTNTRIDGLHGCEYADALVQQGSDWKRFTQQGAIRFQAETDRVYLTQGRTIRLHTPSRKLQLATENSHSSVIWNPWEEKAKQLSQFADDAYQQMLCIESANALDDCVTLKAGQQHRLSVTLSEY